MAKHGAATLRPVGELFAGYGAGARGLTDAAFDVRMTTIY